MDMCALKRPFDDQTQGRIWIETQAVIRILEGCSDGAYEICNSDVFIFENEQNPNPLRREHVLALLDSFGPPASTHEQMFNRAHAIYTLGLRKVDALHIAFAELLNAAYFITCDDGILAKNGHLNLTVKIRDPATFVKEFNI